MEKDFYRAVNLTRHTQLNLTAIYPGRTTLSRNKDNKLSADSKLKFCYLNINFWIKRKS